MSVSAFRQYLHVDAVGAGRTDEGLDDAIAAARTTPFVQAKMWTNSNDQIVEWFT